MSTTIRPPIDPTLLQALPAENVAALLQVGIELYALLQAKFIVTVHADVDRLRCTLERDERALHVQMFPGECDIGGAGVANLGELFARATAYARTERMML